MKLNDIVFAVGIIIISSLLVFVVYDDTLGNPDPMDMYNGMDINLTEEGNISDNETKIIEAEFVNNTLNVKLIPKTNTTDTQSSTYSLVTKKSSNVNNNVQNTNIQRNYEKKQNVETSHIEVKESFSQNMPNNQPNRQNEPVKMERNSQNPPK